MRAVLVGGVLVVGWVPAACGKTRSNDQRVDAGASGGGSLNLGGGLSAGGTVPRIMVDPPGTPDSDLTRYCGVDDFYCETDDCIGIVECEGSGPSRVAHCRCIADLPGAGGEGGMGGARATDGLPPAPENYPGPGCPVSSEYIGACRVPCELTGPCDYGDVMTCCGQSGEDCGASWRRCTCTQTNGQTECVVEE